VVAFGRRRREIGDHAGRAVSRHPRRGQRSLYATPARLKISQNRPYRSRGRSAKSCAGSRWRGPDIAFTLAGEERAPVTWAAALPGARRAADAARRYSWSGLSRQRHRSPRRARRRGGRRLCRRTVADPRQRARAVSVRQRPPGARQAHPRRRARGLFRLSAARPASGGGAVRHDGPAGGRCQCASGQDRGALSQRRACPCADRACAEGRPRPRGQAHRRQYRRLGAVGISSGFCAVVRATPGQLGLARLAGLSTATDAVVRWRRGASVRRARTGRL